MNINIFKCLGSYCELYECLAVSSAKKTDLAKALREKGIAYSTSLNQVNVLFTKGMECIEVKDDVATLDLDKLVKALGNASRELEQIRTGKKKKAKPEDSIAGVKTGHSPEYNKLKREFNKAQVMAEKLKKENEELKKVHSEQIKSMLLSEMDSKVLVVGTARSEPRSIIEKDFFYDSPSEQLDKLKLVSKSGGELESIYKVEEKPEVVFTEENYFKRLFSRFTSGKMFEKRLQDEEGVVKERGIRCDLDENRMKTINLLLEEEMDNQTKLSTYAWWFFHDDPEMIDLLAYAGDHCLNADFVIRLLEKPAQFRNYRTMRAFLQQITSASEAAIKRETIHELLCGDWQVVAEYCGKECHFVFVPVEELDRFRELLDKYKFCEASELIEKVKGTTFGQVDQKLEKKIDETKDDIEPPAFLHEMPAAGDVPCEAYDAALDEFSDEEAKKNE